MRSIRMAGPALLAWVVTVASPLPAKEIYETTTPYHHIRVLEDGGMRTLCFDDATQTRLSIQDPLKGHFEYTEHFHLAWLWNTNINSVLMIGLGGGSAQRAFEHYYPKVKIETVEIDPTVAKVAADYFFFKESERQKVSIADGRMFLRRNSAKHDLIILDAYVRSRYGSAIPQHLVTKEFFELVRDHMNTNGVLAYNVIGTVSGWQADIVGAIYRTLETVYPQVYLFPARGSMNVVIIATRSPIRYDLTTIRNRAHQLEQTKVVTVPKFRERADTFQVSPPAAASKSPVLTDDYAPVEGLAAGGG